MNQICSDAGSPNCILWTFDCWKSTCKWLNHTAVSRWWMPPKVPLFCPSASYLSGIGSPYGLFNKKNWNSLHRGWAQRDIGEERQRVREVGRQENKEIKDKGKQKKKGERRGKVGRGGKGGERPRRGREHETPSLQGRRKGMQEP